MIVALTSTSPAVWLSSGLRFRVQLRYRARRPVKSRSMCPRSPARNALSSSLVGRPRLWYHGEMEWMLLALAGGSGGAYAVQRLRALRAGRRREAADLAVARRLAEEDVAVLGEQLRRLGTEVAGRALDDAARHDYQEALDD